MRALSPATRGLSPIPLEPVQDQAEASGASSHLQSGARQRGTSPAPVIIPKDAPEPRTDTEFPPVPETPSEKKDSVTWMSLPHKSQLAILTAARLSEPITQTSLASYLYHQLASFDPDAPQSVISTRLGFVVASFPATQAFTSVLWGVAADSPRIGRKWVIVIGLLGTAVGSVGFGLSRNWQTAMFWRAFSGVLNGNVGVMRTMISEIVKEKKYQPRAFLLLPLCFNVGTVIGPALGGFLSEPAKNYPGLFGPGSTFGGETGVWWMQHWPYALPNFASAAFLVSAACFVIFGLDETLDALRDQPDLGRKIGRSVSRFLRRFFMRQSHAYSQLPTTEPEANESSHHEPSTPKRKSKAILTPNKLPVSRMWTPNVLANLLSRFLLSMTVGTFQSLWITFLSSPRQTPPSSSTNTGFLHWSGGLGLTTQQVGTAMSILGTIGIILQLTFYPRISAKLGTLGAFRWPLPIYPLVCTLVPFLALLPSTTAAPEPMNGPILWISLTIILAAYVIARTFVLPASAILVNNSAPHPSRLGTLHGVAQSIGASARFLGPMVGGVVFGLGQEMGVVGLAWWVLAGVGAVNWVVGLGVREGDGHEILMEGEVKDGDGNVRFVGVEGDGESDIEVVIGDQDGEERRTSRR